MCREAIILAGGMGTRLKNVVPDKPKPMADVNGKPFLEYLINYLKNQGITRIVLSVGFKAGQIKSYFGNNFKGIKIEYATEDKPLGTGGGILLSMKKIEGKMAFVVNGDTLFNIDLKQMAALAGAKNADITVALRKVKDASRYGAIKIDNANKIIDFTEKKEGLGSALINGGTYLINKDWLFRLKLPDKFSFEKDVLERFYPSENFYGLKSDGYFIDIGLPSTYKQAQTDFLNEFSD